MAERVAHELAAKYPELCAAAPTSRASAVRLFCIECMGGNRGDAKRCAESACPLWPHAWRRGAKP